MENILLPSIEEIIEINKKMKGKLVNRGSLEFIITKVEDKSLTKDFKKNISKIASLLWYDIILMHPFLDGNKRTATEAMQLFLYKNGFKLDTTIAGLVYMSLKIANNEITRTELYKWIYNNLKEN